jgi:phospholipid/cholesterol/gamma-HCH transport system permease protein
MNTIDQLADAVGFNVRKSIETLGGISRLLLSAVFTKWHITLIVEQMYVLGVRSIPQVLLLSGFTGFISALTMQSLTGGIVLNYLGTAVFKAIISEMGPAFTGLVLASRVGSKIAAKVASMRISEQIDALTTLCLDPLRYVIAPRVIACTIMGPVIFIFSCIISIVGAQVLATATMGLAPATFYNSMKLLFAFELIIMGLLKSIVFGCIIGACSSYCGYMTNTADGAIGIGVSIRNAVVLSSLIILLTNIIITALFL